MTINITTCSDKYEQRLDEICTIAEKRNITIFAVEEFRRLGHDSREVKTENGTIFDVHWCGLKRKRLYGVAIFIKREPKTVFCGTSSDEDCNERMIWVDIQHCGVKIRVFACYAPTNTPEKPGNEAARTKFWRDLKVQVSNTPPKSEILILGDLNAKTDLVKPNKPTYFGQKRNFNLEECTYFNENGESLINFCSKFNLGMLNSFFSHKKCRLITHISNLNNVNANATLDYALASQKLSDYCVDCRVKTSYLLESSINTDHLCLIQRWKTPLRKTDRTKRKKKKSTPQLDYSAFKDNPEKLKLFQEKVNELISLEGNDIDEKALSITNTLNEMAAEVLPKKAKNTQDLPWRNDDKLKELKNVRNSLKSSASNFKTKLREVSKLIKKRASTLKRNFYAKKAQIINEAAISRDLEKLFREAKNHNAFNNKAAPPPATADFKGHFSTHFNKTPPIGEPDELLNLPKFLEDELGYAVREDINGDPPSTDEVQSAIKKLKSRKAATDVAPEILKAFVENPTALEKITSLYAEIWKTKKIPSHWRYARLKPLHKKGDANDATNYRGISVGSTQLKILCVIVMERTKKWYEGSLGEGQYGFRSNRGCQDAIYGLKRIQQIFYEKKEPLYCGFIDLKAAFDWVPRDWMFRSIRRRNINEDQALQSNMEIIENVYAETYNFIDGDTPDEAFQTTSGVRQGGVESPTCFNLYLDFILKIFNKKCEDEKLGVEVKYGIPNECSERISVDTDEKLKKELRSNGLLWLLWLGFADDLAILCKNQRDLQRALEILYDLFRQFGLLMSLIKTETMIMTDQYDEDVEKYPTTICTLDDKQLKNVKTFKYLGQKFSFNEYYTSEAELTTRKMSSISSFTKDELMFKNHEIRVQDRKKLYDSLNRTKLTYACQTWSTTENSLNKICSTYTSNLRNLVKGGTLRKNTPLNPDLPDDHEEQKFDMAWKMTNEKVYEITEATDCKEFIKKQQLKWFGHICRLPNNSFTKRLTFPIFKSRRKGRPMTNLRRGIVNTYKKYFDETSILKKCWNRQEEDLLKVNVGKVN